ncbi:MAG: hypothetical protein JRI93_14230, partial [Deltaproteobacteria bacterium]|nr:hypothetical protein [Deltaproteobacteria bacterium]
PGTEVRENCQAYDLRIESHNWNDYHANRAIVSTRGASREMLDEVVLAWEANFDIWLDRIKKRRASGEADEEEAWPLTNLEHTVLMYDLMMKEVIENLDPIPADTPADATGDLTGNATGLALERLVDRVDNSVEQPADEILRTLNHATQRGYLRLTQKNGYSHWEWNDYL